MNRGNIALFIHKEGYKFVGLGLAFSLICAFFSCAWLGLLLTAGVALFFRNPSRVVPTDQNLIVSPVDGTVCVVTLDTPPAEYELGPEKRYKISIFLSILNVHVNRTPAAGKVKKIIYAPGQYLNASLEKSSLFNERNVVILQLDGPDGKDAPLMSFSQIAGTIARRIVCDIHDGQDVKKGEVFGIIRFGSRSDIWLPVGAIPQVYVGQKTIAGETVLTDLSAKKANLREGVEVH